MINEISNKESQNSKTVILSALMWVILSVQTQTANALEWSDIIKFEVDSNSHDTRHNRHSHRYNKHSHNKHRYERGSRYHRHKLEKLRLQREILELELKMERLKGRHHYRPRHKKRKVYTIKCKWLKCRKAKEYRY